MKIRLPNELGEFFDYKVKGKPIVFTPLTTNTTRTIFSAVHVVVDPFAIKEPLSSSVIDWEKTLAFRHHIADLGLGIAEAMDTAQRGSGLNWSSALKLIKRTRSELPAALVFNGVGTDQLDMESAGSLDDVKRAYLEQIEAVQKIGGRLILMASRALVSQATSPDDYINLYRDILSYCEQPVIIHWLGDMFDPLLKGYWGSDTFESASETCLTIIKDNLNKVEGIKISLLDKEKEIIMRRRLPKSVKMYTGDDFNYPELIEGDEEGFSHALLGIFNPLAVSAAHAVSFLNTGDKKSFREILDPTVPLARLIFKAPTRYYKTGVVFLAWLNGFQDHFIMLGGGQAMRSLSYFVDIFKLADQCGLFHNPDRAVYRMKKLLAMYSS